MSRIRVFISFDERHDADLDALLRSQSNRRGSAFEVVGRSRGAGPGSLVGDDPRSAIRAADEVVVICGEHTDESIKVASDLEIAREEGKPYMLLWGRRDRMCTKPDGTKSDEGMYGWTRDGLESQMGMTLRRAKPRVIPDSCKRQDR
jgi:hypothetical protein